MSYNTPVDRQPVAPTTCSVSDTVDHRRFGLMWPWLLLALGVFSSWAAMTALVRFHRPAAFGLGTMMASWFNAEFPLIQIAWEAVLLAVLVWLGALDHTAGVVGAVGVGLAWGGLIVVQVLQFRARPSAQRALCQGLGDDYLDALDTDQRAALRTRSEMGLLLRPFHNDRSGLVIERKISYGDHPRRNVLDVYRPDSVDNPLPVLVQIHGGGWVIGNKRQQGLPLMHRLAHHGYVSVSINYRLGPKYKFPDQLIDVKRAIAWVRANIAEHGGDPSLIILTGGSAGGHLAALAALTPNAAEYQPGFESVDTTVAACMPFYGPTDFTDSAKIRGQMDSFESFLRFTVMPGPMSEVPELYAAMSPINHVRADAPPFFILQGSLDVLVWREESRYFADQLAAVSDQPVVYWEVPHAQHMFDALNSQRGMAAVDACERFAGWAVAHARAAAER